MLCSKKEFAEMIIKELKNNMDSEISATVTTVTKTNNVKKEGIIIRENDFNLSPVIYIDDMYEEFCSGKSVSNIMEKIKSIYEESKSSQSEIITEILLMKTDIFERLRIKLVNIEKNRELIEKGDVPYYEIPNTNLCVFFYLNMSNTDAENETIAMALVTNKLLRHYGLDYTPEELFKNILEQEETKEDYCLIDMLDILRDIIPQVDNSEMNLYVLTNKQKIHGAYTILMESARKEIAKSFDVKYAIALPSSTHEWILIPSNEINELDVSTYKSMVNEVNNTKVAPEEVLDNGVYVLNLATSEFKLFA